MQRHQAQQHSAAVMSALSAATLYTLSSHAAIIQLNILRPRFSKGSYHHRACHLLMRCTRQMVT